MEQPGGSSDRSELVYGLHTIQEILRGGSRPLLRLYVVRQDRQFSQVVQLARSKRVPIFIQPRERLNRLIPSGRHQGIVGLVAAKSYSGEEELLNCVTHDQGPALFVVLDGVEDPQNLGAVLRTAEAAAVHGVFIPERRSVGLTAGVAKASAGALEYIQVARSPNTGKLIRKFQAAGISTYALDPQASIPYTDLDLRDSVALVFGMEGSGIRPGVLNKCDGRATIPMGGQISSLNLSASVAVVLFEAVRQRRGSGKKKDLIT